MLSGKACARNVAMSARVLRGTVTPERVLSGKTCARNVAISARVLEGTVTPIAMLWSERGYPVRSFHCPPYRLGRAAQKRWHRPRCLPSRQHPWSSSARARGSQCRPSPASSCGRGDLHGPPQTQAQCAPACIPPMWRLARRRQVSAGGKAGWIGTKHVAVCSPCFFLFSVFLSLFLDVCVCMCVHAGVLFSHAICSLRLRLSLCFLFVSRSLPFFFGRLHFMSFSLVLSVFLSLPFSHPFTTKQRQLRDSRKLVIIIHSAHERVHYAPDPATTALNTTTSSSSITPLSPLPSRELSVLSARHNAVCVYVFVRSRLLLLCACASLYVLGLFPLCAEYAAG